MVEYAIQVQDLQRSFGELHASKGVRFEARTGEVLSLLGPNGAGKSTTISMLSGLLAPDAGDACVMGHSVRTDAEAAKASWASSPRRLPFTRICQRVRTWFFGARCTGCAARNCRRGWTRSWRSLG